MTVNKIQKRLATLFTLLAIGFGTQPANADFIIISRESEMFLASTNMGGAGDFALTTDPLEVFDVQFQDGASHTESSGAINSGIWNGQHFSSATADLIQADLHSEVFLQQVFLSGNGILDLRNEFEVEFEVNEVTEIELGGSMFGTTDTVGASDFVRVRFQEFNGVVFLNQFSTTQTTDLDTPYTQTLQPGVRYKLLVESHADVFGAGANASGVNVCLRPEAILADVNQDGLVNLLDVDPFINAISMGFYQAEADTNCDGAVNLLDVGPFVAILSGS